MVRQVLNWEVAYPWAPKKSGRSTKASDEDLHVRMRMKWYVAFGLVLANCSMPIVESGKKDVKKVTYVYRQYIKYLIVTVGNTVFK